MLLSMQGDKVLLLNKVKKHYHFDLHETDQVEEYNELLANPAIRVISKKEVNQTESSFSEDFNTTSTHLHVYLEVEECSL
jgi:hypothetical protein